MQLSRASYFLFTVAVTCVARYCLWWDRWSGHLEAIDAKEWMGTLQEGKVLSPDGRKTVDAVYVHPVQVIPTAIFVICHGIGEVVEHWREVQHLLALQGAASLVFDYTGYGRSRGTITATLCEADAKLAVASARDLCPTVPLVLLGFSLGSGVACAIADAVRPDLLVLCAAFTSFRAAAQRLGVPRWLAPAIWDNETALTRFQGPTLLMHGTADRLFPLWMARRLEAVCVGRVNVIKVPDLTHEGIYMRPKAEVWERLVSAVRLGTLN